MISDINIHSYDYQVMHYFYTPNLGGETGLVNLSVKRTQKVNFYLLRVRSLQFCLILHQCNMSASLKLSWVWMSSVKRSLEWERLQCSSCQPCSKLNLLLGKLQHLFYVIQGNWLTRLAFKILDRILFSIYSLIPMPIPFCFCCVVDYCFSCRSAMNLRGSAPI